VSSGLRGGGVPENSTTPRIAPVVAGSIAVGVRSGGLSLPPEQPPQAPGHETCERDVCRAHHGQPPILHGDTITGGFAATGFIKLAATRSMSRCHPPS
jgi:hypothetical protein